MSTEGREESYLRKQAWDYFQVHAAQRLTTFNFYVVISSVITTGVFATFQKDYQIFGASALLGFLLILFSFTFWKLDKRNKELIKNAEAALRFFENSSNFQDAGEEPHSVKLFLREEHVTNAKRANESFFALRRLFTYSDCFNIVFLTFALVGLSGLVFGIIKIWSSPW